MSKQIRRVLFDTSVLLPALVGQHPHHSRAAPRLEQAHAGRIRLVICAHAIAELYSTLTALPISPRIGPDEARELMRENILTLAEIVSLDASDYLSVMDRMTDMSLAGGIIYDALHVQAARKSSVDRLWTINERDFSRIWPDHGRVIEKV